MTTAADVMTTTPVTIRLTARIREAVRLIESLTVRQLPVVNEEGELIGMLSDRILDAVLVPTPDGRGQDPGARAVLDSPVSSLMTGHRFAAVDPTTETTRVVDIMIARHVGAVPVIDRQGSLIGLVSYMDVLRAWPFPAEGAEDPSPDVIPTLT